MKGTIIAAVIFLVVNFVQGHDPTLDNEWEDFVQRYNKNYKDSNETEVHKCTLDQKKKSPNSYSYCSYDVTKLVALIRLFEV